MVGVAEHEGRVEWLETTVRFLSERASGLFIWAETARKSIKKGIDVDVRLKQIHDTAQNQQKTEPLNMLYMTAIMHFMEDHDEDSRGDVGHYFGIVATARGSRASVRNQPQTSPVSQNPAQPAL